MPSGYTPFIVKKFTGLKDKGDPKSLALSEAQTFKNMQLFGDYSFGIRPGSKLIASRLDTNEVLGIPVLRQRDGTETLFVAYDKYIKPYLPSTDAWDAEIITRTTADKITNAVNYDDKIWFSNPGTGADDDYASFDGSTYTQYPGSPQGGAIALHRDRAVIAGVEASKTTIHATALGDLSDFSFSATRIAAEGDQVAFHEGGDPISTVVTKDDSANLVTSSYIFKQNSIWSVDWQSVQLAAGYVDDFSVRQLVKTNTGTLSSRGAYASENAIYFADGIRKRIYALAYFDNSGEQQVRDLADKVSNVLENYNFDEAAVIEWKKKILIACKSSTANFNDIVLVIDLAYPTQDSVGSIYIYDWHVNDWNIYNNKLYFGSSDEGAVYEAFSGFDDDNTAINAQYSSGEMDFGRSDILKEMYSVEIEGYMTEGSEFKVELSQDFDIDPYYSKTLGGSEDYVNTAVQFAMGSSVLGRDVSFGGGAGTQGADYRSFWAELKLPVRKFKRKKLDIICSEAGSAFFITKIIYNVKAVSKEHRLTAHQI